MRILALDTGRHLGAAVIEDGLPKAWGLLNLPDRSSRTIGNWDLWRACKLFEFLDGYADGMERVALERTDWHQTLKFNSTFATDYKRERVTQEQLSFLRGLIAAWCFKEMKALEVIGYKEWSHQFGAGNKAAVREQLAIAWPNYFSYDKQTDTCQWIPTLEPLPDHVTDAFGLGFTAWDNWSRSELIRKGTIKPEKPVRRKYTKRQKGEATRASPTDTL